MITCSCAREEAIAVLEIRAAENDRHPVHLVSVEGPKRTPIGEPDSLPRVLQVGGRETPLSELRELTFGPTGTHENRVAVGQALHAALAGVLARAVDHRRVWLDVHGSGLDDVPWELLHDGERFLFADPDHPHGRGHLDPPGRDASSGPDWPLRIMIVVGSKPDDPAVGAEDEVAEIEESLVDRRSDVHLWIVEGVGKQELLRRLENVRPHVLHFIGHGRAGPNGPFLDVYDAKANAVEALTSDELAQALTRSPELVVLSACRTGRATPNLARSFMQVFQRRGAVAVVGMQGDLGARASKEFAAGFYQSLVDRHPVEHATAEGRRRASMIEHQSADWLAPVLEVQGRLERRLCFGHGIDAARRRKVSQLAPVRQVEAFVDRSDPRWTLWRLLEQEKEPVVVVRGAKDVGKTACACLALESRALLGKDVRYVSFARWRAYAEGREPHYLDVLRNLRDVAGPGAHTQMGLPDDASMPLPLDAFAAFHVELDRHLGPGEGPDDSRRPMGTTQRNAIGARLPTVVEAFRQGMFEAAKSMLIVLDQLENVTTEFGRDGLIRGIVDAVAQNREARVQMVLVVNHEDHERFEVGAHKFPTVDVPLFDGRELRTLLPAFVRQKNRREPQRTARVAFARNLAKAEWPPLDTTTLQLANELARKKHP